MTLGFCEASIFQDVADIIEKRDARKGWKYWLSYIGYGSVPRGILYASGLVLATINDSLTPTGAAFLGISSDATTD
jgi:hypothetical protein